MRFTLLSLLIFLIFLLGFGQCQQWGGIEEYLPNTDIGTCTCDLIYPHCDPNCCCDSACDEETLQTFEFCLDSGIDPNLYDFCVSPDEFRITNYVDENTLGGQLCIAVNNNPSQGKFYSKIDTVETTAFENMYDVFTYDTQSFIPNDEDPYSSGDPLRTRTSGFSPGYFSIPAPDTFGGCTDRNFAKFMVNQPETECLRQVDSLDSTSCTSIFGYKPYLDDLQIAVSPSETSSNMISVTVDSISCTRLSASGGGPNSTLCTPNTIPSTQFVAFNGTTSVCEYALKEIHYRVLHQGTEISAVSADVVLGPVINTFSKVVTSLTFVDSADSTLTAFRSGNPGYQVGLPVLLGYLNNDDTAILVSPNHHKFLGSNNQGQCLSIGGPWVSFMEDTVSGCVIDITSATFAGSTCIAFANQVKTIARVGNHPDRVAMFGDADPNNLNQWIEIIEIPPPSGTCEIVKEIRIEFMVTRQGALSNPQWKIVSARISYGTTPSSGFECYGTHCSGVSSTPYEIRSIVSFIKYPEGGLNDYIPPPAGGLPSLPDDIFYPFKIHSSTSSSSRIQIPSVCLFFYLFLIFPL